LFSSCQPAAHLANPAHRLLSGALAGTLPVGKSLSMPSDDRLWLDHDEAFSPFPPNYGKVYPEEPISLPQSLPWMFALQNGQLLPQS
jgi:hypothetical protein